MWILKTTDGWLVAGEVIVVLRATDVADNLLCARVVERLVNWGVDIDLDWLVGPVDELVDWCIENEVMSLLVYEAVGEDPKGLVDGLIWWLLDGPNFLTDERIVCVVRKGAGWLVEKVMFFLIEAKEEEVVFFFIEAKEEEVGFFLIEEKEEEVMFFPIGEEVIGLCMTKEVTGGVEDGAGKTVGNTCTALVDERTYV